MPFLEIWATALAAGIPDELFWRTTPVELSALLEAISERETDLQYLANLRAGMVVAGQYNTQRTKATDRVWKATDFVRRPGEPDEIPEPDPEVLERFFDDWMAGTNKAVKA